MSLSEIAAGVEVTSQQRNRGVAVVDTTVSLEERLAEVAAELPCTPTAVATVVEGYTSGKSIGKSAGDAGLAPITGAKALHLLGEPVSPLGPAARDVVRRWLDARLSRSEALDLIGTSEQEFALAAYIETHDPLPGTREHTIGALILDENDPLEEARSDLTSSHD